MDAANLPPIISVLIADPDAASRATHRAELERMGWEVQTVRTGQEALALLARRAFDAAVVDLQLEDMHGADVIERSRALQPGLPIVAMAANAMVDQAVEAMRAGAVDFLAKSTEVGSLHARLAPWMPVPSDNPGPVRLGACASVEPAVAASLRKAADLADTSVPIAIYGPAGSGRRFLAGQIHEMSGRGGECLIVEAGHLPAEQVRGRLQGASASGAGGTVVVADPQALAAGEQELLVRLLSTGSDKSPRIMVTLPDAPGDLAQAGRLDRRLAACLEVVLPAVPLAARRRDIPLLVEQILGRLAAGEAPRVTAAALRALREYDWPGNIRQLRLVLERAARLADGKILELRHLPILQAVGRPVATADAGARLPVDLISTVEGVERDLIAAALARTNQNQAMAAVLLGVPRTTLRDKLNKYGFTSKGQTGGE